MNCTNCKQAVSEGESFCSYCGTPINTENRDKTTKSEVLTKTIRASGSYSGKITKGKTSKSWQRFKYAIIITVVVILIAFIIWFQVDPDAGEKLKTFFGGILVIAIFLFFIFKRNKKSKRRGGGRSFRSSNRNDDDRYDDNDYDDDENDDYDDDDGDDDND